jgi:hypothetical protein
LFIGACRENLIKLPSTFHPIHKKNLLRIGSKHDGGYVLTKEMLEKSDFLLSFGLFDDWTFEQDFSEKKNNEINIHVYDHTTSQVLSQIKRQSILNTIKNPFSKTNWQNISIYSSYRKFFDNTKIIHFQERVWCDSFDYTSSIDKIFERIDSDNVFLKMDIEGSEYRVIDNILNYSDRIVGMSIEFHDVDILYDVLLNLLNKIKDNFNIVHIHANNFSDIGIKKIPIVWEITFENKKFSNSEELSSYSYPIKGIDMPCNPNSDDISFTFV